MGKMLRNEMRGQTFEMAAATEQIHKLIRKMWVDMIDCGIGPEVSVKVITHAAVEPNSPNSINLVTELVEKLINEGFERTAIIAEFVLGVGNMYAGYNCRHKAKNRILNKPPVEA